MDGNKFCANCGNDLKAEDKFCPKCGADVKPAPTPVSTSNPTSASNSNPNPNPTEPSNENFTDKIAKNNPIPRYFKKSKEFVKAHKKQFIIGGSVAGVFLLGVILFNIFWDFTKLEWDKEYSDVAVNMTSSRKITLNVKAENREKEPISEINFSGDGELEKTTIALANPVVEY